MNEVSLVLPESLDHAGKKHTVEHRLPWAWVLMQNDIRKEAEVRYSVTKVTTRVRNKRLFIWPLFSSFTIFSIKWWIFFYIMY